MVQSVPSQLQPVLRVTCRSPSRLTSWSALPQPTGLSALPTLLGRAALLLGRVLLPRAARRAARTLSLPAATLRLVHYIASTGLTPLLLSKSLAVRQPTS